MHSIVEWLRSKNYRTQMIQGMGARFYEIDKVGPKIELALEVSEPSTLNIRKNIM